MELKIQNLKDVLDLLPSSDQVEAGDFFLFQKCPLNWKNKATNYPLMIEQSDATITVLDQKKTL